MNSRTSANIQASATASGATYSVSTSSAIVLRVLRNCRACIGEEGLERPVDQRAAELEVAVDPDAGAVLDLGVLKDQLATHVIVVEDRDRPIFVRLNAEQPVVVRPSILNMFR